MSNLNERELLELAAEHLDRLITLCSLEATNTGEVDAADELSEQIWQHLRTERNSNE